MSLESKINEELRAGMKAREADKVSVLRMLKAAIDNQKIQKKTEDLPEEEILQIIQKQVKQRRESIESFEKAGRQELANKEKKEIAYLEGYLPKQLSDEELTALIKTAVKETGASTKEDIRKVMPVIMPKVKGKADGKRVNQILSALLEKK